MVDELSQRFAGLHIPLSKPYISVENIVRMCKSKENEMRWKAVEAVMEWKFSAAF